MIDGEGSFVAGLYMQRTSTKHEREQLQVQFRLAQRADDVGVPLRLFDYFGCGKMNFEDRVDPNPRYVFQLTSKEDLKVLIKHVEKFPLQSKKAIDYAFWLPIAQLYLGERGGWQDKREFIRELCETLRDCRKFDPKLVPKLVEDAQRDLGTFLYRGGKKTWRMYDPICSIGSCGQKHYAPWLIGVKGKRVRSLRREWTLRWSPRPKQTPRRRSGSREQSRPFWTRSGMASYESCTGQFRSGGRLAAGRELPVVHRVLGRSDHGALAARRQRTRVREVLGLFDAKTRERVAGRTEQEIYDKLCCTWREPEER